MVPGVGDLRDGAHAGVRVSPPVAAGAGFGLVLAELAVAEVDPSQGNRKPAR